MKDLKANTGQFLNVHSSKIGVNTDTPTSDLHVTGTAAVDGTLSVGNAVSFTDTGAVGGTSPTVVGQTIVWDGSKWIVGSSNSGGAEDTEVPASFVAGLTTGQSVHTINFQQTYTTPPPVVTDLECGAGDPIIPYVITSVTTSNMTVEFAKALPSTGYKLHISFGGRDVFWTQGTLNKLSYTDGDVSISNNLEVGGNLTISGETMTVNTTQMTIEDHNITIASTDTAAALTGAVKGDAGITWGNDNKVRLVYDSAKGFAFDGGDLNGNVGIGTTTPSSKLDVVGGDIRINDQTNGATRKIMFDMKNTGGAQTDMSIQVNNGNMRFYSDAQAKEYMRISSGGNVGIGTASPVSTLHVDKDFAGVSNAAVAQIGGSETGIDFSGIKVMRKDDQSIQSAGSSTLEVINNGTVDFTVAGNGNVNVLTGNMGVGIPTPSSKLELYNHNNWGTAGVAALKISNFASGGDTTQEQGLGDIEWATQRGANDNAQAAMIRVTRDKPNTGNGSSMRFFLNQGGSSVTTTERMRINKTGDVKLYKDTYSSLSSGAGNLTIETAGVARTAGEGPFINFRVPTDSTFAEDMANIGAVCSDSTASSRKADLVFWTRNDTFAERMRITSDGKVGIGTGTGPTKQLDVNGTMKTRGIMRDVTDDAQAWQAIRDGDATINLTDNGYNTSHAIGASLGSSTVASNNTGLYIGAYGVGSNSTNVHVKSGIHLDNHYSASKGIRFFTGTGTTAIEERMRIFSNGNISIGAATANEKLRINAGGAQGVYSRLMGFTATGNSNTEFLVGRLMAEASNNYDDCKLGIDFITPDGTTHEPRLLFYNDGGGKYAKFETSTTFWRNPADWCYLNLKGKGAVDGGGGGLSISNWGNDNSGSEISCNNGPLRIRTNNLTTNEERFRFHIDGGFSVNTTAISTFKLYVAGGAYSTVGWTGSDDRLKHNEQTIQDAIGLVGKLKPVKYIKTEQMYDADHDFELDSNNQPIDDTGSPVKHDVEAGVIAQDLLQIPELNYIVKKGSIEQDGDDESTRVETPHSVNYNSLLSIALKAIQEQQAIIDTQNQRIDTLEQRLQTLESK